MTTKSFLWVIPKWTLPATDGARVATDNLIKNMVKCGAQIDVLCLGNPGENIDFDDMKKQWGVRNIFYRERPLPQGKISKLLFYAFRLMTMPLCPLTMSSFNSLTVQEYIAKTLNGKEYDYLFLDGLHLGACFFKRGKFRKPEYVDKVIYRAHNIESDIWIKAYKEEKNLLKKIILKQQSWLVEKYEREIIKNSDLIAPISIQDDIVIRSKFNHSVTHVTLMGMSFDRPLEYEKSTMEHFLFLGRLDWPPNRDGLKWLLENVWPEIDTAKKHLHVAGSGDRSWLKAYENTDGITFHGFVDDINDLYLKCSATLVPIFYGSGTRIKVIETYTKGRSMISTTMGAQGSNLQPNVDFSLAETKQDWIQSINDFDLDESKDQAKRAISKLVVEFDAFTVAQKLYSKLS